MININCSSWGPSVWRIVHLILVNVQFCVAAEKKKLISPDWWWQYHTAHLTEKYIAFIFWEGGVDLKTTAMCHTFIVFYYSVCSLWPFLTLLICLLPPTPGFRLTWAYDPSVPQRPLRGYPSPEQRCNLGIDFLRPCPLINHQRPLCIPKKAAESGKGQAMLFTWLRSNLKNTRGVKIAQWNDKTSSAQAVLWGKLVVK